VKWLVPGQKKKPKELQISLNTHRGGGEEIRSGGMMGRVQIRTAKAIRDYMYIEMNVSKSEKSVGTWV